MELRRVADGPRWIRHLIVWVIAALATPVALAQRAYISWPNKAAGDTLAGTLDTFQRLAATNPEISQSLEARKRSLAVVFVPGVLGSKLVDRNGTVVYGDLSNPLTLLSRLELPGDLVDEKAESGIQPSLLPSLGPMDLYGEAVEGMTKWASANSVKFITCGYDWRRDIRAGARDLERCLSKELQPIHRDVVLIAHSMGGLVSWTWAMAHERGTYSADRRLIQLTILGSPLRGSCEIVRMIQSGYVQPKRDEAVLVRSDFKPLTYYSEKLVDAFKNWASGSFTQGIRPLVLTWPGALELSPPTSSGGPVSCVGVPPSDDAPAGTPATSYYDPQFWTLPAGKQMLRKGDGPSSYPTSASLPSVLAKAKEFRSSFSASQLRNPAWLYFSRIWMVPSEAGYRAPYISEADQWSTAWGDGRVPEASAKNRPDDHVFSHIMGVESVHGNLPSDPNFFDDYFGTRLPMALAAVWATDLMKEATQKPSWIEAFAKLRAQGAEISQVRSALEPRSNKGKESSLLKDATATVATFNGQVCAKRGCASTYAGAKSATSTPAFALGTLGSLAQFSAAARTLGPAHPDYPYAEGNRGLVLARRLDWASAAVSIQAAQSSLLEQTDVNQSQTQAEAVFQQILRRNLAKSLVESGQCKAAEPVLRETIDSWSYSREALAKPCNDVESGLQYCFDKKDYCSKP